MHHRLTTLFGGGLRGLLLLMAMATGLAAPTAAALEFSVVGFEVIGDNPLSRGETDAVLAPYVGTQEGVAGLQDAARALETMLRERGHSFHRVLVPPQTLDGGIVKLQVLAFRVGTVTVTGSEYAPDERVRASLPPLAEEAVLNGRELARSVRFANENPVRQVLVAVRESAQPDHVDVDVRVTDRRPWSLFAAAANNGTEETGRGRLTVGAQHADVTGHDDVLSLSATRSPGHWSAIRQYGASYSLPLPAHALSLTAFYSRSDADSGTVAEVFDVTGAGTFAGVRLRHVLLPIGAWSHAVSLGVEDHLYENDSTLLGVTPIGVDVRSRPLTAGYSATWEAPGSAASFGLYYVRNLAHGGGNDSAAYLANQAGAKPAWDALRGEARYDRAVFDDWLLRTRSSGQWAGEPLISGERFGVGGAASVRGLEEREISADDGVYAGIELWTPPLGADVRLLGFVDLARYRQRGTATGTVGGGAASAGLGLRWYSTGRASLLVDVARVIDGAGTTRAGDYGVHVNLLVRY